MNGLFTLAFIACCRWQSPDGEIAHIARWLPGNVSRYGLRAQFRVNNVFAAPFPKYVHDDYGSGVQPYGDWRGRVYSVSLTSTFLGPGAVLFRLERTRDRQGSRASARRQAG